MIDKQMWHDISMRGINTSNYLEYDSYLEMRRAMWDIDTVDVQIRFLDGIFDVMDNE